MLLLRQAEENVLLKVVALQRVHACTLSSSNLAMESHPVFRCFPLYNYIPNKIPRMENLIRCLDSINYNGKMEVS
jgi:hypothetical protein